MHYKLLNKDMTHHGFTYKEGLNVDTNPFGEFVPGLVLKYGLYFTDDENLEHWTAEACYVADVTFPADAHVVWDAGLYPGAHRADRLILSNIRPIPHASNSVCNAIGTR